MTVDIYFGIGMAVYVMGLYAINRTILSAIELAKRHHRDRDKNVEAFYQQLQWQTESLHAIRRSLEGR